MEWNGMEKKARVCVCVFSERKGKKNFSLSFALERLGWDL
jgi:hypothetical protein